METDLWCKYMHSLALHSALSPMLPWSGVHADAWSSLARSPSAISQRGLRERRSISLHASANTHVNIPRDTPEMQKKMERRRRRIHRPYSCVRWLEFMSEKKLEELNYYILTRALERRVWKRRKREVYSKKEPRRKLYARIEPYRSKLMSGYIGQMLNFIHVDSLFTHGGPLHSRR